MIGSHAAFIISVPFCSHPLIYYNEYCCYITVSTVAGLERFMASRACRKDINGGFTERGYWGCVEVYGSIIQYQWHQQRDSGWNNCCTTESRITCKTGTKKKCMVCSKAILSCCLKRWVIFCRLGSFCLNYLEFILDGIGNLCELGLLQKKKKKVKNLFAISLVRMITLSLTS